jgi:uncharacterized protein with HEPN domain
MRRDNQRLQDIFEALDSVAKMIAGRTDREFLDDEVLRYAVAQRLTVFGEAAARLSSEISERNPSIPWADIIGFRNILVHPVLRDLLASCMADGERSRPHASRAGRRDSPDETSRVTRLPSNAAPATGGFRRF